MRGILYYIIFLLHSPNRRDLYGRFYLLVVLLKSVYTVFLLCSCLSYIVALWSFSSGCIFTWKRKRFVCEVVL